MVEFWALEHAEKRKVSLRDILTYSRIQNVSFQVGTFAECRGQPLHGLQRSLTVCTGLCYGVK